eukprot:TRINITY_DN9539_c0_g1_i2.p1 TRINITY_DN9539_c0_g1~~TRINITY_DN9539_c0_g1_i2.p1  ORF type:complete len:579 (+),score=91.81 TRINITY_DN9539_c0_g1_i2:65-1738(+)
MPMPPVFAQRQPPPPPGAALRPAYCGEFKQHPEGGGRAVHCGVCVSAETLYIRELSSSGAAADHVIPIAAVGAAEVSRSGPVAHVALRPGSGGTPGLAELEGPCGATGRLVSALTEARAARGEPFVVRELGEVPPAAAAMPATPSTEPPPPSPPAEAPSAREQYPHAAPGPAARAAEAAVATPLQPPPSLPAAPQQPPPGPPRAARCTAHRTFPGCTPPRRSGAPPSTACPPLTLQHTHAGAQPAAAQPVAAHPAPTQGAAHFGVVPPPPGCSARAFSPPSPSEAPRDALPRARSIRVPGMPPFTPSRDRAHASAMLEAAEGPCTGVDPTLPDDPEWWAFLEAAVRLCDGAQDPPHFCCAAPSGGNQLVINQDFLRAYVAAWRGTQPLVVTVTAPDVPPATFTVSTRFWQFARSRLGRAGGEATISAAPAAHAPPDSPPEGGLLRASAAQWAACCAEWEAVEGLRPEQRRATLAALAAPPREEPPAPPPPPHLAAASGAAGAPPPAEEAGGGSLQYAPQGGSQAAAAPSGAEPAVRLGKRFWVTFVDEWERAQRAAG